MHVNAVVHKQVSSSDHVSTFSSGNKTLFFSVLPIDSFNLSVIICVSQTFIRCVVDE